MKTTFCRRKCLFQDFLKYSEKSDMDMIVKCVVICVQVLVNVQNVLQHHGFVCSHELSCTVRVIFL